MKCTNKGTKPMWKRVMLIAFFLTTLALLIPSTSAFADDCLRDPLNAADCIRTSGVRQVITTLIGVAGTGGVVIQNLINGTSPGGEEAETETEDEPEEEEEREEEEDFPGEDPCAGNRERFNIAKANLRALLGSRESIQNYLTMLETQYENTRQSSYWRGAVNVAMLGSSVFGRAIRGAIGMAVSRTLAQNIAVSMATAFGSSVATNVLNALSGAGINPEDLVKGPRDKARNEIIKQVIKDAVIQQKMEILGRGLNPNGPVYQAVLRGVDTNWASPAANLFGDTMSVLTMTSGMIDGVNKLEAIRGLMSRVQSQLSNIDLQLEDARAKIELAQHSLDLCLNSESHAGYLRRLAFSRLPSQG
ncbi:MAG: hypothetical protein A2Z14_17015 [Chloroflexi bacterium RBG_16_48_8]|nr:MAG: hypothetical protein A2Z14_17015 [Chloroflexi bacterium RBG_16_48_8]